MIDFEDEEAVLEDVGTHLKTDPDFLWIENDKGLESFGAGTVVENDEEMRDLALAVVKHFLAHYDGNYHETPEGLVYWRVN